MNTKQIMKTYQTPTFHIMTVELDGQLLQNTSIHRTTSNVGITGGTEGSSEAARVKGNSYSVWDDDWSE